MPGEGRIASQSIKTCPMNHLTGLTDVWKELAAVVIRRVTSRRARGAAFRIFERRSNAALQSA